jgi:PmbA protein
LRPLRATQSGAARPFWPDGWASRSRARSLTIVDDNTMLLPNGAGGFGTSPFDGEGLPSLRTVVVENGVLRNYLLNTYTARKLGMKSTHNASRGLAGTPGIGCGNLYLEPGTDAEGDHRGFRPGFTSPA